MKKLLLFLTIAILSGFGSCVNGEAQKKAKEKLAKDSAENSAPVLWTRINKNISEERYEAAKNNIADLKKRHPKSSEAAMCDSLSVSLEGEIKKQKDVFQSAFTSMRKEKDEVQGMAWYSPKSAPKYNNRNAFYLYFSSYGVLYLRMQYYGDDWLFIKNYTVKADDKVYTITPTEVKRDNNSDVWEWCDVPITPANCEMINAIISAQKVTVRSNGRQYYKDRQLTATEKKDIQTSMQAYWSQGWKVCK